MPEVETRYAVEGWGVGELVVRDELVVAHWFDFDPAAAATDDPAVGRAIAPSAHDAPAGGADGHAALDRGPWVTPPVGAHGPPSVTLAADRRRVGHGSVPRQDRCRDPGATDTAALIERVRAHLGGADVGFEDVALDLGGCTPFQLALTEALRGIPRGEVVTYGELAALAGRPGAQRAAGTFCASNRFWLVVPCHRVVAADGIGGYGSAGAEIKRRLLALEGVSA